MRRNLKLLMVVAGLTLLALVGWIAITKVPAAAGSVAPASATLAHPAGVLPCRMPHVQATAPGMCEGKYAPVALYLSSEVGGSSTPTPSPTPAGEPEWDIMQEVVASHPDWTCSTPGGTPGHRTLYCYTGAGHTGSGSVDNYGDPASASANWQQRRTHAQSLYPVFQDTSWNDYPGYHGEGEVPPYNFFTQEDYYWAGVRVLGGTRVDDTHFHYAPDIASAIMNAAQALGYLPPPSPTPTYSPGLTPTSTPSFGASVTPSATPSTIPSATSTHTPVITVSITPTFVPDVTPTSCPLQFIDVPQGSTFYPFIRCLVCRGIVVGYADGTFRPNSNVTRGQLAKIVSNTAGLSDPPGSPLFEDVPAGSTFFDYIQRLASRTYMSGYPCGGPNEPCGMGNKPYFRPNSNATRGQISKIVSNAAGFNDPPGGQHFQDVPPLSAFYDYINRLSVRTVMSGYPCGGVVEPCGQGNLPYFRPNSNATRGQASKIVANTFLPGCDSPARK